MYMPMCAHTHAKHMPMCVHTYPMHITCLCVYIPIPCIPHAYVYTYLLHAHHMPMCIHTYPMHITCLCVSTATLCICLSPQVCWEWKDTNFFYSRFKNHMICT